jgi:hypothetical protein
VTGTSITIRGICREHTPRPGQDGAPHSVIVVNSISSWAARARRETPVTKIKSNPYDLS